MTLEDIERIKKMDMEEYKELSISKTKDFLLANGKEVNEEELMEQSKIFHENTVSYPWIGELDPQYDPAWFIQAIKDGKMNFIPNEQDPTKFDIEVNTPEGIRLAKANKCNITRWTPDGPGEGIRVSKYTSRGGVPIEY